MKHVYVFTQEEMAKVEQWLMGAKSILDSDSERRIEGCKAAIDNALRELLWEEE